MEISFPLCQKIRSHIIPNRKNQLPIPNCLCKAESCWAPKGKVYLFLFSFYAKDIIESLEYLQLSVNILLLRACTELYRKKKSLHQQSYLFFQLIKRTASALKTMVKYFCFQLFLNNSLFLYYDSLILKGLGKICCIIFIYKNGTYVKLWIHYEEVTLIIEEMSRPLPYNFILVSNSFWSIYYKYLLQFYIKISFSVHIIPEIDYNLNYLF